MTAGSHHAKRERQVAYLMFAMALGLLILGNWKALAAMVRIWVSGGHPAEVLVLLVGAWLLWRARDEFFAVRFRAEWRGLLLIVPAGIGLMVTNLIHVRAAQLALLVVAVFGLVWSLLGRAALRPIAYPLAFLLLALPIWDSTKPILQDMTVHTTALMLRAVGVPYFIDGTYINVPSGTMLVLEECSGSQFFQAGVIAGALFAYLSFRAKALRVAAIGLFAGMVILGNWLRVWTLVLLGPQSELQHFSIGWGVFAASIVCARWLAMRLSAYDGGACESQSEVESRRNDPGLSSYATPRVVGISLLAVVVLAAMPMAAVGYTSSLPAQSVRLTSLQPNSPWSGPYETEVGWRPLFAGADDEILARYQGAGRDVILYVAYYESQDQGAEAVGGGNSVYDPEKWHPRGGRAGGTVRRLDLEGSGRTLSIIETRLSSAKGEPERLVWHWFRVAGRDVGVPWHAKLLQIVGLLERRNDALAIVLSVAIGSDLEEARAALANFVHVNFAQIDRMKATQ